MPGSLPSGAAATRCGIELASAFRHRLTATVVRLTIGRMRTVPSTAKRKMHFAHWQTVLQKSFNREKLDFENFGFWIFCFDFQLPRHSIDQTRMPGEPLGTSNAIAHLITFQSFK